MSIAAWKKEFYPTAPRRSMSRIEALEHSLRKWRGVRPRALARHELHQWRAYLATTANELEFDLDTESCALCVAFYDRNVAIDHECARCPLFQRYGSEACLGIESAYCEAISEDGTPERVIRMLEATLRAERRKLA